MTAEEQQDSSQREYNCVAPRQQPEQSIGAVLADAEQPVELALMVSQAIDSGARRVVS